MFCPRQGLNGPESRRPPIFFHEHSPEAWETCRACVRTGGTLIATGDSPRYAIAPALGVLAQGQQFATLYSVRMIDRADNG